MSARTNVVQRAVELIGPDNNRRAECVNAVHVALSQIKASEADVLAMFHRQTKDAKKAAGKLRTAIHRLQDVLKNPHLPENLVRIFPNKEIGIDGYPKEHPDPQIRWPSDMTRQQDVTQEWLTSWRQQAEAAERATGRVKFHFKAEKKLIAAEQAHRLLRQFDRDISATEGSTFCKLAALLNDTPKANFHHPCRTVLSSVRK